jgi:octaprenyl-diphosphate synthase
MDFKNAVSLVKNDLNDVESLISKSLDNSVPLISDIGRYLSSGRGKHIRPVLVLLTSKMNGYEGKRSIIYSTVVELIHMATLLHDDVVDKADKRRGSPSVNSKWGNQASILIGDYLFAKSFSLMSEDSDCRIINSISRTVVKMAEGEVMQLMESYHLREDETPYMERINRKTASLMSSCCEIGALLGNNGQKQEKILPDFGLNVGMAFQLVDDALDYVAKEDRLGKPICKDLREGNITLPLIHLYRTVNGSEKKRIKEIIESNDAIEKEHIDLIVKMVKDHGAIDYTLQVAKQHVEQAKKTMSGFKNSEYLEALLTVADYIVERDF